MSGLTKAWFRRRSKCTPFYFVDAGFIPQLVMGREMEDQRWQDLSKWYVFFSGPLPRTDQPALTQPDSLRQIDPNTLTGSKRSEYDRLKRIIYRGVCQLVMASLERRSHNGETLRFGDGVVRTAYPGVLIESMDFEEMAA